jgi:hypothetical protein
MNFGSLVTNLATGSLYYNGSWANQIFISRGGRIDIIARCRVVTSQTYYFEFTRNVPAPPPSPPPTTPPTTPPVTPPVTPSPPSPPVVSPPPPSATPNTTLSNDYAKNLL